MSFMSEVVSVTTDQGTEKLLSNFPHTPLSSLVPWSETCVEPPLAVDANGWDETRLFHPPTVDTTHCLHCAGMLHVVHNMMRDLKVTVPGFEAFLQEMTQVARLLGKKYSLERLLATCCSSDDTMLFRPAFNRKSLTHLKVYEGRWGSVATAIQTLGELEPALRACWSREKYTYQNAGGARGRGAAQEVDVGVVDSAICSHYFWCYRASMEMVANTVEHCMHWAETCICHGPLLFKIRASQTHAHTHICTYIYMNEARAEVFIE